MASSFPTTFEQGSQSQNQSSGSNPISYQANVNRQKTRKWVDAKAANYGGDDWGDDSDEYDDYDQPPPPVSKAAPDNYKKSYGSLPPAPEARPRANSFDADDEKRNFSNQTVVPSTQEGPPTRFSQITGVPSVRQPSGPPPLSISTQQEGQAENAQSGRIGSGDPNIMPSASSDGRYSTGDYQARRDYSPTAAPAPLTSRSPGPQSAVDSPSSRFPARKSSMSHPKGPTLAQVTRSPEEAQTPSKIASPAAATGKALPFVRPADIYRRAEEERRQSIESGSRPTMISPVDSRPTDRLDSTGAQLPTEKYGPENPGGRRRTSIDRDESPGGRYLAPGLESVKERKSEYGFDGFSVTDAPKETGPSYRSQPPLSDSAKLDVQDARRQSTSPKLPDLNRMSGFGMDMFAPSKPDTDTNSPQQSYNQTSNVNLAGNSSVITPESHPSDDEQLAPPKTLNHAASEQSFRPNLPGGWTSYATTNRTETPQPEDSQTSLQRYPDSDDIVPTTTTKHVLPQSASGVALANFETGATRGEHDNNSSLPPPPPFSGNDNNAMPTPDHTMAPSGNLYSTTTLDPRLLPKSDPAPAGAPPPPPAKDTPIIGSQEDNSGYFPSSATYTTDSTSGSHSLNHPQILARGNESDQEENDRLEEEIVSRLSPQPREMPRDSNLLATTPGDTTRESTYLPDYYWTSTEDEARTPPLDIGSKQGTSRQTNISSGHATPTGSIHRSISQTHPVAPLSVAKSEHSTNSSTLDRPLVKHRFSWEQSSENVSVTGENRAVGTAPPSALSNSTSTSALSGPNFSTDAQEQQPIHEMPSSQESEMRSPSAQHHDDKIAVEPGSPSTSRGSIDERHIARASVLMGGAALSTGATVAAIEMNGRDSRPERRASLAEEKATRVSSYPVTVTPPEHEHPARSTEPYFSPTSDHPPPSSSVSPINSPAISQPPPPTSRLLAFKEIMNMKSPHQRIQTFDETRQRFAAMDSGLTNWMEALRAQQPEHANSTGSWVASGPGAGKGANVGAPVGSTQPPYYQQYPNGTSASGTPASSSKPGPNSAPHQGHPSAGASAPKITTQQVQAKGKELLHTAGIFGGKAGKVGKGFLAKGKSKFLGGGGDKTSPPPKPKHERRSSWGLPLSKPKSSAPSDKSNRLSRQITPVPTANAEHKRSATMTSISSQPPQLPPNASTGDVFGSGSLSGTRDESPALSYPYQRDEPVTSVREIRDADQSTTESEIEIEERDKVDDSLAPPRPIGKHQPSWDPFNATPIAEEQGSAYDTRPNQQSYPFPAAPVSQQQQQQQPTTLDPHITSLQNDHVKNGGMDFHDAVEDPGSIKNDWIMVTPEAEIKQEVPKPIAPPTSMMHRARGSNGDVPILPIQTQREFTSSSPAPLVVSHSSDNMDAVQSGTREQAPVARARQEEVQAESAFIPPIRRTSNLSSALAYKFGSRKGKQRFPLEDEDEDGGDTVVANGPDFSVPTNTSHVLNADPNGPHQNERTLQPEDSGYATERSGPMQQNSQSSQMPSGPPRPTMGSTGLSHEHKPANESNTGHIPQDQQQISLEPRPPLIQTSSSEYSQRSVTSEASGLKTPIPRPNDVAQPGDLRRSQDAWRPNAPPLNGASQASSNIPMPAFAPRQSWETQRPRGGSGSGTNLAFRPDLQQERQWSLQSKTFEQPPSSAQRYPELFRTGQPVVEPHDQNPGDLPAHYYQAPITREAAFLPRQQTNEYQIPGVGPPSDDPRGLPRRNSNFFKDVGGKISRATSRERRKSVSQEDDFTPARLRGNSKVDDDADSSIISAEGKERTKRRSGFFGGFGQSSTGLSNAPHSRESVIAHAPSSRTDLVQPPPKVMPQEKKRSFFGGSASNPPVSKPNKVSRASISDVPEDPSGKKKRFSGFGIFASRPDSSRASTPDRPQATREMSSSDRQPLNSPGNTSNFPAQNQLPRGATPTPQGQINQPLQGQRGPSTPQEQFTQPLPAQSQQGMPTPQDHQAPSQGKPRAPIPRGQYDQPLSENHFGQTFPKSKPEIEQKASRSFLSKMKTSSTQNPKPQVQQQTPMQTQQQETRPRKASKTRRASAGGLLGGFMGRKHSHDVNSEEPRVQESQQQARNAPPGRTYSGIGEQQAQKQPTIRQVQAEPQLQNRQVVPPPEERGRQAYREPRYDSVPIPTGYNLVRAQGGHTVPTDYDPRGYRSQQSGFQSSSAGQIHGQSSSISQGRSSSQQTQPTIQQNSGVVSNQPPHLSALENYRSFVSHQAPNRLSREDLLARSPALPVEGQQRPYQLSLPENNDDRDYPVNNNRSPTSPHESSSHLSNPRKINTQHDPVERLQEGHQRGSTPHLRQPDSPATYPLPDNVVFSPINPSAEDFPPPPPPKDNHLAPDHARTFSGSSYLAAFDLNRSGTHRTAVSAMSGTFDPPSQNDRSVARRESDSVVSPNQPQERAISNSSPTPPSPVGTPMRIESPDHVVTNPQLHKTTILEAPRRPSLDLYDASPLGTPQTKSHPNGHTRSHSRQRSGPPTPNLTIQTQQPFTPPTRQAPTLSPPQAGNESGNGKNLAELEGTKADGFNMRLTGQAQEEKIFYDAESGMRGYGDAAPSMSATSYPGQEWNPYGAGAWVDDEEEDVSVMRR